MGLKAEEEISLSADELQSYLRSKSRVFMSIEGHDYYITHTDGYWRVQDCEKLNDKGRFTDCSELASTLSEFIGLPWLDGKSTGELAESATFAASIQEGWTDPATL